MTAIDDFLKAIESAGITSCEAWSDDCVLDATVPNWRFQKRGPDAIKAVYAAWYAYRNTLLGVRRWPIADGEVVEYSHRFTGPDGPRQAHHVHVLQVAEDRIVRDTMFCGGQWTDAQLAEMAAADN
jgi:hypothetical protein